MRANRIEVNDKHGGALPGSPFPNLATGPRHPGRLRAAAGAQAQVPAARRRQRPGRERDPVRPRGAGDGRRPRRASGAGRTRRHDRLLPQHLRRRRAGHQAVARDMKPLTAPAEARRAARAERNRNQSMVDMNLVSLIDVFTILIFFLMSNVGVETLASTSAVQLPESMSQKAPEETVLVVVTGSEILVGGKAVASVGGAGRRRRPDPAAQGRARRRGVARGDPQGERERQQARDDHGRQGHPLSPAAQGDVHGGARRLQPTSRSPCGRGSSREGGARGRVPRRMPQRASAAGKRRGSAAASRSARASCRGRCVDRRRRALPAHRRARPHRVRDLLLPDAVAAGAQARSDGRADRRRRRWPSC